MGLFQRLLCFNLLGLIGLLPLVSTFSRYGHEQAKVMVFIAGVFIGLLWYILSALKNGFHFRTGLVFWLASLFLLVLILSSVLGFNPTNSFQGNEPYYQGWLTYLFLYLFFILVRSCPIPLNWWIISWSGGAGGVGLLAIRDFGLLHWVSLPILNYAGRPIASFGSPNLYAGFLLLVLPMQLKLMQSKSKKLYYLALITGVLSIGAIIVSSSRTAIVLAGLLLFGWGMTMISKKWQKKYWQWALALTFLLLIEGGLFFARQAPLQFVADEMIMPFNLQWQEQNAPEKRVLIWPVLIHQFWQRPLLGYGLENTAPVFRNFFPDDGIDYPAWMTLKDLHLDRAHNYLMDLAIWSGGIGLLVWLILVGVVVRKSGRSLLTVCAVLYLVWIQFQIQSIVHLVFWWWLMAQIDRSIDRGRVCDYC